MPQLSEQDVYLKVRRDLIQTPHILKRVPFSLYSPRSFSSPKMFQKPVPSAPRDQFSDKLIKHFFIKFSEKCRQLDKPCTTFLFVFRLFIQNKDNLRRVCDRKKCQLFWTTLEFLSKNWGSKKRKLIFGRRWFVVNKDDLETEREEKTLDLLDWWLLAQKSCPFRRNSARIFIIPSGQAVCQKSVIFCVLRVCKSIAKLPSGHKTCHSIKFILMWQSAGPLCSGACTSGKVNFRRAGMVTCSPARGSRCWPARCPRRPEAFLCSCSWSCSWSCLRTKRPPDISVVSLLPKFSIVSIFALIGGQSDYLLLNRSKSKPVKSGQREAE